MENKDNIGLKLMIARRSLGLTQGELANKIGTSRRTIQNWERGEKIPETKKGIIENIIKGTPAESTDITPTTTDAPQKYDAILWPVSAMGGSLTGFDTDGVMAYQCERIKVPIRGVDYAVPVQGDSMAPRYPSGAIVLIKRIDDAAFIVWGAVYLLDTINGLILKEIQPAADIDKITCHSQNPSGQFKDFDIAREHVRGMYRVLGIINLNV